MIPRKLILLVSLLGFALWSCKGDDPEEYAKKQGKSQEKPRPPSQIIKIQTPVAVGAKVKCEDCIDLAKFTEGLEQEDPVTLQDQSAKEADPTSICSIRKGGEPPSEAAQAKTFEKNAYKIGVVGGDEYCLAHLYCGYVNSIEDMKRKCDADGMSDMSDLMGQPTCVRRTQRAAKWAYKYNLIDADTECVLEVQGGPSVTDQNLVETCALAFMESLTKEGISKPYMP